MNDLVSLKPLVTIGYSLETFNLTNPDSEGRQFTYYTFDEHYRPELLDTWEFVGLHQQSNDPWLLNIRFLHIDLEMFDFGEFVALRDAPSYLRLHPATMHALIEFFEDRIKEWTTTDSTITHFHLMNADELKEIHLPTWKIPYWKGETYRYLPDTGVQSTEEISIFSFPAWDSKYGTNQVATLEYDSFHEKQLTDPVFEPFGSFGNTHGVGTVTFNQRALEEFIILLKQHSYETFLKG